MNVDGIMTLQNILKSKAGGMPYEKISRRYAQIDAKNKHNYKQLNFQL